MDRVFRQDKRVDTDSSHSSVSHWGRVRGGGDRVLKGDTRGYRTETPPRPTGSSEPDGKEEKSRREGIRHRGKDRTCDDVEVVGGTMDRATPQGVYNNLNLTIY